MTVDLASQITVKDSVLGANAYSVQLNLALTDGSKLQSVYQVYPGPNAQFWAGWSALPGQGIDKTSSAIFNEPMNQDMLSVGGGIFMAVTPYAMMLWPRRSGFLHGSPIYIAEPPAAPIRSVALDIVGVGDGSEAVFTSSAFAVDIKLQGIEDMAYAGYGPGQGIPDSIADLCGSPYGAFNTSEGGNLTETVVSSSAADGWLRAAYGSP